MPYYTPTGKPTNQTRGLASEVRYEFTLIETAITAIGNLSFSASLPSQAGNAGKYITTDGTNASWTALVLKTINSASINAAGNIDLATLGANTFTAAQSATSFIPTSATVPTNGMYLAGTNTIGWATNGTSRLTLNATGDLTATGTVGQTSDERLKTNWRDLPINFVKRLSLLKAGIYDRTDQKITQVGVPAQALRRLMPNAVNKGKDGMLSVAYGNAALVACVMLAREIEAMKSRLSAMESKQ